MSRVEPRQAAGKQKCPDKHLRSESHGFDQGPGPCCGALYSSRAELQALPRAAWLRAVPSRRHPCPDHAASAHYRMGSHAGLFKTRWDIAKRNLLRHHYVWHPPPERRDILLSGKPFRSRPRSAFAPRPPLTRGVVGLAALLALGGVAALTLPVLAQETPYEVQLTGVEDSELRSLLEGSATLFRLAKEPPPSPIGLRRRADADRERLQA